MKKILLGLLLVASLWAQPVRTWWSVGRGDLSGRPLRCQVGQYYVCLGVATCPSDPTIYYCTETDTWNVASSYAAGIPGPAGPAGPIGPAGPSGVDGAPGVPGYSPNSLQSGGGVTWVSGMTFTVSAATYIINNTQYTSPQTNITLDAAGAQPRFDIVVVNDSGAVAVVKGTEAATPAKPTVDLATQLELTEFYVPNGATSPTGVASTLVYAENTGGPGEWTTTVSGAGMTAGSTVEPIDGTKSVLAVDATSGQYVQFVAAAPFDLNTKDTLNFAIKSSAPWNSKRSLQFYFMSGTTRVGSTVVLNERAFGFSSSSSSVQNLAIPVSLFSATSNVDTLRIVVAGSQAAIGFRLDDVKLQSGIPSAGASSAMNWRGAWNATTSYAVNDVVTDAGTWIALASNVNSEPTSVNTNWSSVGGGLVVTTATFRAVICAGGTGSVGLNVPVAGYPQAGCVAGTNSLYGVAQFADTETQTVQDHITLPASWSGNVDLDIYWRANVADNAKAVVWQVATACVADGEVGDPSWNAAQKITSNAKAVANQWVRATQTAVTTTGCAASEEFMFKVFRDPTDGSDNLGATAEMISLRWTVRHN